ncbi:cytohesin-1-like, partial [Limulus polyphemus]|uniref:Cytohesin-1-like n=1 Tax=Limulus polyphemus TaxID=6850 RepID=A0ABM1BWZ2_LIMPO
MYACCLKMGFRRKTWTLPDDEEQELKDEIAEVAEKTNIEDESDNTNTEEYLLTGKKNFSMDPKKELREEIANVVETIGIQQESKTTTEEKHLSIGKKKFNMDPKKGIEYLIAQGQLDDSPQDIARFLYKGEGLSKTAVGEYLGERDDFNIKVLDAFIELHDFANLILVQALRQFLWSFHLPGEAQKIDRMMEKFAQHYFHLNAGVFHNPDTCYVLSFAVIMLNTSLHNPSVKEKPSVEQFINMNRGINDGGDMPEELLVVSNRTCHSDVK